MIFEVRAKDGFNNPASSQYSKNVKLISRLLACDRRNNFSTLPYYESINLIPVSKNTDKASFPIQEKRPLMERLFRIYQESILSRLN